MIETLPTPRYFLLADHFEQSATGKVILIGLFDRYFIAPQEDGRIIGGGGFLVAEMLSSLANGTVQPFELVCVDEDETPINTPVPFDLPFAPAGDGRPWRSIFVTKIGNLEFPRYGEFEWQLHTRNQVVARCPIEVHSPPPTA